MWQRMWIGNMRKRRGHGDKKRVKRARDKEGKVRKKEEEGESGETVKPLICASYVTSFPYTFCLNSRSMETRHMFTLC